MNIIDYAVKYIEMGLSIFPLKNNTKDGQIIKSWKLEATNDYNQVKYWWGKNTNFNIGIKTGDGLLVIDIDNKNGKNGTKIIEEFYDRFPKTFTVRTPNGGYHLYYKINKSYPNKVNLYDGIDVRCEGGYVVAPPSIVNCNRYEVIIETEIADANDSIYQFLEVNTKVSNKQKDNDLIYEGTRNDTLFKLGCSLQSKGFSDETIEVCLLKENEIKCKPPLANQEVMKIVRSITSKYEKNSDENYRVTWKSAVSMSQQEIGKSTDIIEGFLPIGLTLCAAPAKLGKTFFNMQMANTLAKGEKFLGYQTKKCKVYYLAFEDSYSLQIKRLKESFDNIVDGYDIEILEPYQKGFNLEKKIINYLHFNSDLGVVVIDTFEKMRTNNERIYSLEYKELTEYRELALKYKIAIIVTMHTIKNINYNNIFSNITGSGGVLASADAMMVMVKNRCDESIIELHLDGKAIPSDTIYLKQDKSMICSRIHIDTPANNIDSDLLAIIRYVISNSKYNGSLEKLGVLANVTHTNGKHLRHLLDHNKGILESYFIRYTVLQRTSYSRKVELVYYGEDIMNDGNDDMTKD